MSGTDPRLQCSACGTVVTPALGSCSWCGRPVDAAATSPVEPTPQASDPEPSVVGAPIDGGGGSGRGRGRKFRLLGGAAGAVVVAAVVVVVLLVTGGGSSPSAPTDQRAKDARDVAAALETLEQDPGSLRAASQSLAEVDARAAVPSGATVVPDEGSWSPDGAGGGVMRVELTTPDGTAVTYLAVVVHEDAGWKVVETFPAPTGSPASGSASPTAVSS